MKVCIIGLGVGMAHICALVRTGHSVEALIDIDPERLKNAKDRWRNEWCEFVEEVDKNPQCYYGTSFLEIPNIDFDLVIIAVPPDVQKNVYDQVRSVYPGKILLEKPIKISENELDDSTFVCCEWINHSSLEEIDQIDSIRMSFPKSPEEWKKNFPVYHDLMPHIYSIFIKKGIDVKSIHSGFSEIDRLCVQLNTSYGEVLVEADHSEPHGLQINGELYDWEEDLFDKYYDNMLLAKKLVEYEKNIGMW